MNLLQYICLLYMTVFLSPAAQSQFVFYNERYVEGVLTWEIGAAIGAMNCLTDLGGRQGIGKKFIKDINIRQTRISTGIAGAVNYKRLLSLKVSLARGSVSADDAVLANDETAARARYLRNLSFNSSITETSLLIELYPLALFASRGDWLPRTSFCIFSGLGFFHFNPQTEINGSRIDLWPLRTEGQGFEEYPSRKIYARSQFNLPVGIGTKMELNPRVNIIVDFNYRILFTDYLDDVSTVYADPILFVKYLQSPMATMATTLADRRPGMVRSLATPGEQRGSSLNKDGYFSLSLGASFVLGRRSP